MAHHPNIMYLTASPFITRISSDHQVNAKEVSNRVNSPPSENIDVSKVLLRIISQRNEQSKENSSLRIIKKKQNIFKSKADAQAFREKNRLKRELLEKQLLNLKIDKMRLQWENDQLRIRQDNLEHENLLLKKKLEDSQICCHHPESVGSPESTVEHASFVNFPRPKDRVLFPKILALLMVLIGEVSSNSQKKPYSVSQATSIYQILNKCVISAAQQKSSMKQTTSLSVP